MKRPLFVLSILMALFLLSQPVRAGVPMDTVRNNVSQVLDVLNDPKLKAESAKEIKKEKLRLVY